MSGRETSAEIDAVAADWATRVDNTPLAPHEQAEFDAWLAGDTRRLGAYARAQAMFVHARRAKALGPNFDPDLFAGSRQAASSVIPEDVHELTDITHPSRRRFLAVGGGAGAALGMLGLLGWSWQAAAQTHTTKRGEIRLVPLDDGSSVTLNTDSTVTIRYRANERRVELVRGEAWFDVARDRARPFVVTAGDTLLRAVGTSFSVQRLKNTPVQVVVRTGVVEATRANMPTPQRLIANTRTISAEAAAFATKPIAPAEVSRALAWREGSLSFEDMPLSEVVEQFARYSDLRISFADPAIGTETVTGLYAANNPAGFAKAVARTLHLQVEQTPDAIYLHR